MFDFHMHSRVSFDGHDTGLDLALAAKARGLKEICFTDHMDYDPFPVAFHDNIYGVRFAQII